MVHAPRSLPALIDRPPLFKRSRKPPPSWFAEVVHRGPRFTRWPPNEPKPQDTKGGKWVAKLASEPCFAEIAILRAFEAEAEPWEGRWIDNYPMSPVFRTAYWDDHWNTLSRGVANKPLPTFPRDVSRAICTEAGDVGGAGLWDVI